MPPQTDRPTGGSSALPSPAAAWFPPSGTRDVGPGHEAVAGVGAASVASIAPSGRSGALRGRRRPRRRPPPHCACAEPPSPHPPRPAAGAGPWAPAAEAAGSDRGTAAAAAVGGSGDWFCGYLSLFPLPPPLPKFSRGGLRGGRFWRPRAPPPFPCPMSAWLGRAALLLGRPGGPAAAAAPSSCLGSLRGPPPCCCRRRHLGSLRGGAEGLLHPRGSSPPPLPPPGGRALGTHPKKEPMEALNTAQGARDFIYSLHSTERSCLLRELHRFESIAIAQGERRLPAGRGPAPAALPPSLHPSPPAAALRAGGGHGPAGVGKALAGLRGRSPPPKFGFARAAPWGGRATGKLQQDEAGTERRVPVCFGVIGCK